MHAFLYIGNDIASRTDAIRKQLSALSISAFDEVVPATDTMTFGIGEIREFIRRLSLAPHESQFVAGVIHDAERLTQEAQHALLKTIEEPPPRAYIFLGAPHTQTLLPTIVSRCLVVRLPDLSPHDPKSSHVAIESRPGELLHTLATTAKTKEEYEKVFDEIICSLRSEIINKGNKEHTVLLHRLLTLRGFVANNVHPLSLIEHALLDKANSIRYNG
ncbi:MAG TPA: hypothetical protein VJB96_03720 [Patescibacteria group bacterium]|nr:hypothetical protein [Patescibacteria group bacterium]